MYVFDRGLGGVEIRRLLDLVRIDRDDFLTWAIDPERLRCECRLPQTACATLPMQLPQPNPKTRKLHRDAHAVSRLPSFNSFCGTRSISTTVHWEVGLCRRTKAFIVPCSACLWFLRNLGSVPFRDGYLEVFGFLILGVVHMSVQLAEEQRRN